MSGEEERGMRSVSTGTVLLYSVHAKGRPNPRIPGRPGNGGGAGIFFHIRSAPPRENRVVFLALPSSVE